MAGAINQNESTFSGRTEVQRGNITQVGSITAGGNVGIGKHIYSEAQNPS
jgi:hypothetical protein